MLVLVQYIARKTLVSVTLCVEMVVTLRTTSDILADSCRLDNPSKYSIRSPPNTLARFPGGYSGVLSSFPRLVQALFKSST